MPFKNPSDRNAYRRRVYASMPSEVKEAVLKKRREAYANMSLELKESALKKRREADRQAYANMPPEVKSAALKKRREAYANRPPDEAATALASRRKAYESMTTDVKDAALEKRREAYANRSPDEAASALELRRQAYANRPREQVKLEAQRRIEKYHSVIHEFDDVIVLCPIEDCEQGPYFGHVFEVNESSLGVIVKKEVGEIPRQGVRRQVEVRIQVSFEQVKKIIWQDELDNLIRCPKSLSWKFNEERNNYEYVGSKPAIYENDDVIVLCPIDDCEPGPILGRVFEITESSVGVTVSKIVGELLEARPTYCYQGDDLVRSLIHRRTFIVQEIRVHVPLEHKDVQPWSMRKDGLNSVIKYPKSLTNSTFIESQNGYWGIRTGNYVKINDLKDEIHKALEHGVKFICSDRGSKQNDDLKEVLRACLLLSHTDNLET